MLNKKELGHLGEKAAAALLIKKGWSILFRNVRTKFGELDLIAKDGDGILVFIEVKTIGTNYTHNPIYSIRPEDNMTTFKIFKLNRMCNFWARLNNKYIDFDAGWRIDFIGIELNRADGKIVAMRHYKNIY